MKGLFSMMTLFLGVCALVWLSVCVEEYERQNIKDDE